MKRPPTEETVVELAEHAERHRANISNGEGWRYTIAHSIAYVGLRLASQGHAMLDKQDKQRGYR